MCNVNRVITNSAALCVLLSINNNYGHEHSKLLLTKMFITLDDGAHA